MLKTIRYAAYGLIALLSAGWSVLWFTGGDVTKLSLDNIGASLPSASLGGLSLGGVTVGGPFALTDTTGAAVTNDTYRGRWMLVFFGFTFCPDVCPTGLQTISAALDKLGPAGNPIVPIFITIDPERDTPAALGEYVKLFDDRLVGLTGTKEQIAAAAKSYRVYFAKVTPKDASAYLMDHSSFIYLIGPDGSFRALFRHGVTSQELADALKMRLSTGS